MGDLLLPEELTVLPQELLVESLVLPQPSVLPESLVVMVLLWEMLMVPVWEVLMVPVWEVLMVLSELILGNQNIVNTVVIKYQFLTKLAGQCVKLLVTPNVRIIPLLSKNFSISNLEIN